MTTDLATTDRWLTGELGNSAEHAVAASKEHHQDVDASLGLQMISIRLPRKLIDDLKLISEREGLGYQPLMRRVLLRFAAAEFRNMAHESLVSELHDAIDRRAPEDEGELPLCAHG